MRLKERISTQEQKSLYALKDKLNRAERRAAAKRGKRKAV